MATKQTKKKTRYFKFLQSNNESPFAYFDYSKYLPKDGKPGRWMPLIKSTRMCERGYHACKASQCGTWADDQMFEVELRGVIKEDISKEKVVAQQIRFLRKIKGYGFIRFTDHLENIRYNKSCDEDEENAKIEEYVFKLADKSK